MQPFPIEVLGTFLWAPQKHLTIAAVIISNQCNVAIIPKTNERTKIQFKCPQNGLIVLVQMVEIINHLA